MDSAQDKLIKDVVKAFEKKFGEGHATTLTKMFSPEKVRGFIPTGNLALDYVIGRPGFPIGRITEVAGPYSAGKSSVCACSIGAAQKAGIVTILIDTEHSYSSEWSEMWGVNPERLILVTPKHLQDVFDKLRYVVTLIKEDQPETPIFIVIDSVSACPSAEELEEEDSTSGKQRAQHAKIIAEGLRKISDLVWNQNVAILFVSQLKDDPGSIYGANKHKLGGHAIEFHASLMIEIRRNSYLKEQKSDEPYGQKCTINTIKNKFVPPFRKRTFDLYFKEGIRPSEILLEFLGDDDLYDGNAPIKKAGGWFEYGGAKYRKEDLAAKLDDSISQSVYETLNIVVDPKQKTKPKQIIVRTVNDPIQIQQPQEESKPDNSHKDESKSDKSKEEAAVDSPADSPRVNIKDII